MEKVYACYLRDTHDLAQSSSGGAFTALSNAILRANGTVVSCEYDYNQHKLVFDQAEDADKRNQMRGSKYIQAESTQLYSILKTQLAKKQNTPVFVVGTPCQIAGARAWVRASKLKLERPLIFCDVICHGVSSPIMWKNYIEIIENKENAKVIYITFKDKEKGWLRPTAKISLDNDRVTLAEDYAMLYRSNDFMRESCYRCRFSSVKRVSDITIGDFWGIDKVDGEFANMQGTSFIMTNTPIGEELFHEATVDLCFKEKELEDCLQPNMQYPTPKGKRYAAIHADYEKHGLDFIIEKYVHYGSGGRLMRKIRRKILQARFEENR